MLINFKEAFTFMFKDEKFWQKYIIGTLFAAIYTIPSWILYPKIINRTVSPLISNGIIILTLILGLFVYGFGILYTNSKITLKQDILPDWGKDFSRIVKTGLKYIGGLVTFFIASFIALLPIFIILGIIAIVIVGIIAAPSIASIGPNINPNDPYYMKKIADIGLISVAIMFILFLPVFLVWMTSIFLSIISFLTDLKFGSFFNFKRMWSLLKGNFLNLFIILIFSFIYGIITQILLKILGYNIYFPVLLIFSFYITLVYYNLYAQFALNGIQKHQQRIEEKEAK